MRYLYFLSFLFLFSCGGGESSISAPTKEYVYFWQNGKTGTKNTIPDIIKPQAGFTRIDLQSDNYEDWIRNLPLKESGASVTLSDGTSKPNQNNHAAVVDIDYGTSEAQKSPQAIIRLRAEYFWGRDEIDNISFKYDGAHADVTFPRYAVGEKPILVPEQPHLIYFYSAHGEPDFTYNNMLTYLGDVYKSASVPSLKVQTEQVNLFEMRPGDMFISDENSGQVALVLDVAKDKNNQIQFLIGMGGDPAQSFHVVKNAEQPELSPWFSVSNMREKGLITPEASFSINDLRRFK